jgi:DNA (cytosine-5)-methyltransferase 1
MRELSLFTGAGGGLLASRSLGWTTVTAVERDAFCQRILRARQLDGLLDPFDIYNDVGRFRGEPGRYDVVSGGFPCQPFSSASRGRITATDLWPDMLRIVLECRAEWVFAENVCYQPIQTAAEDLYAHGYCCAYMRLQATDLGAPHERGRLWLVAHANPHLQPHSPVHAKTCIVPPTCASKWWSRYPGVVGVPYGLATRLDRSRLQVLGNGQVPAVAVAAWRILKKVLDERAPAAQNELTEPNRKDNQHENCKDDLHD